jgi:hypothetical protein
MDGQLLAARVADLAPDFRGRLAAMTAAMTATRPRSSVAIATAAPTRVRTPATREAT